MENWVVGRKDSANKGQPERV